MSNQSKKIIILIISLLFLSSASLFFFENYYKKTTGGNWWVVYFENPKSDDLTFIIESKKTESNFAWELWLGNNKIKEGKENVSEGGEKTINPTRGINLNYQGRASVKISSGEDKREIYKNL